MTEPCFMVSYPSRFGTLQLVSDGEALTGLLLPSQLSAQEQSSNSGAPLDVLQEACRQLQAFFEGKLQTFDLPLAPRVGTDFQRQVWSELRRVPFGTTISYSQLAAQVERPSAVRAVGAANGRNPIPIIVPCHRVIGSDGSLTGYAGGVKLKQSLLDHEASCTLQRTRAAMAS